jgi:hypothetical protein
LSADFGDRGDPSDDGCVRVPAMRCKIEEVEVMKSRPETKCVRVPRQFCRKKTCASDNSGECYFRNQAVRASRKNPLHKKIHCPKLDYRIQYLGYIKY